MFLLHSQQPAAVKLAGKLVFGHGTRLPADQAGDVVIHWGGYRNEVSGMRVLQPIQAILRAQHAAKRNEVLKIHGIKTPDTHGGETERKSFPYQYKVAVFHLETIAVFEKIESLWTASDKSVKTGNARKEGNTAHDAFVEVGADKASYRMRRAVREAHKAIYALGLDYGVVTIGIVPDGHTLVLEVDPEPRLSDKLNDRFAAAMNRYQEALTTEPDRMEPVMLGADPEFLLLSPQGKVVPASRFLQREGAVGCDAIVLGGHRVILPLAELRPRPSHNPRELAGNLHRTMRLAARRINDESLSWLSGGMPLKGFPLGGHIHFSRCWLNSHLLRALDNYLALPLLLIEGETARSRRPRYGFLGDYRRQPHGGFEYRTLPSWLVSPAVARGVLSLAALIAGSYRKLPGNPLQHPDIQAYFYTGKKELLLGTVHKLWNDLESLEEAYAVYAADLKPLKEMIFAMKSWDEMQDFRKAWKIAPFNRKEAIRPAFML